MVGNVTKVSVGLGQLETYQEPAISSFSIQLLLSPKYDPKRTSQSSRHLAHVLEVGAQVLPAGARSYMSSQTVRLLRFSEQREICTFFGICGNGGGGVTYCIARSVGGSAYWHKFEHEPILKS